MNKRVVAKTLFAAKKYIEEHGWARGTLEIRPNGSVCALGAIARVEDITIRYGEHYIVENSEAARYLDNYLLRGNLALRNLGPDMQGRAVFTYNDHLAADREAMLEVFEQAACQACKEAEAEDEHEQA